jgi:23S rRNA (cytidine1920-2'-O)/16S rRNA (cytidine1409-2'-O)-methyltransferase
VTRRRLDAELVRRGLAASLSDAREAVRTGLVTVHGAPATNEGALVMPGEPLGMGGSARRFVSRGGTKLLAALDRTAVDPRCRDCLDAGASTGGFTDCLLQSGASRVAAVDVGYGQLAWELRNDPRVTVLERTNARDLSPDVVPFTPQLVVADLSFISLRLVLPALLGVSRPDADLLLLVKPQFEAAAADVGRGGVVEDPTAWRAALDGVARACRAEGATPLGAMASPLLGPAGNVEFFVHARRGAAPSPVDLDGAIVEGEAMRR